LILASQILNIVVIGGMIVGLFLIVGVAGALLGTGKSRQSASASNDPAVAELDDRLRKLTLASPFAEDLSAKRDSPAREMPGGFTPDPIRPSPGTEPVSPGTGAPARPRLPAPEMERVIEPPAPTREPFGGAGRSDATGPLPVLGRPALPGDALGRPFSAQPIAAPRGPALDPLAARFSGSQRLIDIPPLAPPTGDVGGAGKRRELPGTVADTVSTPDRGLSGPEFHAPETDRFGFSGGLLNDPPTMAEQRGGTGDPALDPFAPQSGAPRRAELPGAVAGQSTTGGLNAPALDIRAILRGEAGPMGTLPPSTGFGSDPAINAFKPSLHTGPLPAVTLAGPVGAVPFDSRLLELRALKPDPNVGSARSSTSGVVGQPRSDSAIAFDAAKLMDDFDLPDAGFETHVFSTAELVDDEAAPTSPYDRLSQPSGESSLPTFSIPIAEYQADPGQGRELHPASAPYGDYQGSVEPELGTTPLADLTYLTPEQEGRAGQELDGVAQLAEVLFVKLMAADGSVMLERGVESGDSRTNQHLAALITVAGLEMDRCALGSVTGITLESSEGVLVLSSLGNGAVLAVLLGNPARLGMLRRQLKRPVGSLRSLLMESSVS
jgi:predicted regulator of Ras-like GTPase activity (Roadblock/LC7/MglB family)